MKMVYSSKNLIQFNKISIELDTKIHNCSFDVKLGTEVNPNFRNLMKMFVFFSFGTRNIIFGKIGPRF